MGKRDLSEEDIKARYKGALEQEENFKKYAK